MLLLLLSLLLSCPVRHLLRLVLGAAAAAAAPPPLPLMSVINGWVLEDAIGPEKAEMTDSNGQNASVPQHSISTKAIALLVGARPTAPCASGALLSPMLSIRELQAPRPGCRQLLRRRRARCPHQFVAMRTPSTSSLHPACFHGGLGSMNHPCCLPNSTR